MATAGEFRKLALSLEGTTEVPHFGQAGFRVARIYATLTVDEKSANLKLLPDEQAIQIEMEPDVFAPVSGKWGAKGWTSVRLRLVSKPVLAEILRIAWLHAQPLSRKGKA
jgi:YjbR